MPQTVYESFPARFAFFSALVAISVYALGAYVLSGTTLLTTCLYIASCALLEVMVLKRSCVHCYYYGRVCGRGKGMLASLLFRRGDPRLFVERQLCWWGIAPELMATLLPLMGGGFLLLEQFTWGTLGAMATMVVLSLGGNVLVRRSYACKYCKQKELGWPALAMLSRASVS
jgi:hypothetical protein